MTKEQKDKILRALTQDRNCYARECERRIAGENGKIIGADYMVQRFLDVLSTEVESESEEISREEIASLLASGANSKWSGEIYPGEFEAMEHNGRMDALESEDKMSDYILELEEACNLLKDNCTNSKCETCIFNTDLSKPNCRIMDTPEIWPVDKIFDKGE